LDKKRHHIDFITKNNPTTNMKIGYDNKLGPYVLHTKFLGMNIGSTLSWKTHIEQLISKLSTTCCVINEPCMSHTILIMIYYSLFHFIMNCCLIFGGNSPSSCKIFRIQGRKGVRIITECRSRYSCWNLFKKLKILPLSYSTYLLYSYCI
jgi:hypothetical protein